MSDPSRASDNDREDAARVLRDAHVSGMLTVAELTQRLEVIYAARTVAELASVTRDLPVDESARQRAHAQVAPRGRRRLALGLIGGSSIRGRFRAARHMLILSIVGGGDIDLSDAEIEHCEVTITSVSLIGGGDIYLPAQFDVDIRGFSLVGSADEHGAADLRQPPIGVVRVRYLSLLGGPDIHHQSPRRSRGR